MKGKKQRDKTESKVLLEYANNIIATLRELPNLSDRQWNIPKRLQLSIEFIPENNIVKDYEVEYTFEQIGQRILRLNGYQLRVPKQIAAKIAAGVIEEEGLILPAIEDITERKRAEA